MFSEILSKHRKRWGEGKKVDMEGRRRKCGKEENGRKGGREGRRKEVKERRRECLRTRCVFISVQI